MFLIFLIAAVIPHPGGSPTEWQPLIGIQHVNYRWSRPTSNSCLVEVAAVGTTSEPLHLRIDAKVLTRRPDPPISSTTDSPMYVEPTKIKPQTEEREFSVELQRYGHGVQDVHDCYGVMQAEARMKSDPAGTTNQPQIERGTSGKQ